nr:hypothetical protein [Actinophrys sol]
MNFKNFLKFLIEFFMVVKKESDILQRAESFHIKKVLLNDIRSTFPKYPYPDVSDEFLEFLLMFNLPEEKFLLATYYENEILEIIFKNQHIDFIWLKILIEEFMNERDYENCKIQDFFRAIRCPYEVALSFSKLSKKEYDKEMFAYLNRIGYKY